MSLVRQKGKYRMSEMRHGRRETGTDAPLFFLLLSNESEILRAKAKVAPVS